MLITMNQTAFRHSIIVDLSISADSMRKLYAGRVTSVFAHSRDGRRIRFPVHVLRPYVSHTGVTGSFQLVIDSDSRLQDFLRIA